MSFDDKMRNARELRNKVTLCPEGQSKKSVEKVIEIQKKNNEEVEKLILNFEIDSKKFTKDEAFDYKRELFGLKNACKKKLNCLRTGLQVADLETLCWNLSSMINKTSVMLSNKKEREGETKKEKEGEREGKGEKGTDQLTQSDIPGYIGQMSQSCIFSIKDGWNSISKLTNCIHVHLKNAANYHNFYHEVDECEKWMEFELEDTINNFEKLNLDNPDKNTINYFLTEFEAIHRCLSQWRVRLDRLLSNSNDLVPVPLRSQPITTPLAVRGLENFFSDDIKIRKDEDLTLLEAGDQPYWKVSNYRGLQGYVPSITVLIPGPDPKAVKVLERLRFLLLSYWTTVLKNYGLSYMKLLLNLYKNNYDENQQSKFESLESWDKENIKESFSLHQSSLEKYWKDTRMFNDILERFGTFKLLLETDEVSNGSGSNLLDNKNDESNESFKCMINATVPLSESAKIYKIIISEWETYKTSMDIYNYPELMLVLEKWSQLQYLPADQVANYWKNILRLNGLGDESNGEIMEIDGMKIKDNIKKTNNNNLSNNKNNNINDNFFTENIIKEKNVNNVLTEKFVIGSGSGKGGDGSGEVVYFDTKELKKPQKSELKIEHGGMSEKEMMDAESIVSMEQEIEQTYTIIGVTNPETGKDISLDDAMLKGIIVPNEGLYKNIVTKENMPIPLAMNQGLIKVSMTIKKVEKTKKSSVGIVTIKSLKETDRPYEIKKIIDVSQNNKKLNLNEAVDCGVLINDNTVYFNKLDNKKFNINQAIKNGWVEVEYQGNASKEEVVKRYAVRAVVDLKEKETVSFDEAVKLGIIDRERGQYIDRTTNKPQTISQAIIKGLIKAREISEDEMIKLNIDPSNQIILDKTKFIKEKLIKPLTAIGAFRSNK